MISKLDRLQGRDIYENTALAKINELVDAVNKQQIQLNNHECRLLDLHSRITALDDPTYHEEPADPYAEQRKWIGKACWFWDGNAQTKAFGQLNQIDPLDDGQNAPYQTNYGQWYEHCKPVKPDDNIIYKGE